MMPRSRMYFLTFKKIAYALTALCFAALLTACQTGNSLKGATGASSSGLAHMSEARAQAGLTPLKPDSKLEQAAMRQALYMVEARRMSHDTGWRRDFATRMKADNIPGPAAENLAHGRMEMSRVFEMWMQSTGHRKNMLDSRFEKYGLAYALAPDGRRYWALVLGK